jgi:hypothetical protein
VDHLVGVDIAIDAEVVLADLALVATTLADTFVRASGSILTIRLCRSLWFLERAHAGKTRGRRGSVSPGHLHPVPEWEEVVVAASEMGRQDEGEATGRALGGETADASATASAGVPFTVGLAVARAVAYTAARGQSPRGEAHHEQTGDVLLGSACDGRGGGGEEELTEVDLVHGDVVLRLIASVCSGAKLCTNGEMRRQADNRYSNAVGD